MTPSIEIINESTVVTDEQLKTIVAALQTQVSRDFLPVWGVDASLKQIAKGQSGSSGTWWLVILDDPDQADALGYHDLTTTGLPMGKVFAKADLTAGSSLSVTISHELLEMLGDPDCNALTQNSAGTVLYCFESCDAVEADQLGYQIDGVLVSDFVTKAWFCDAPGMTGPYDFCGHVKQPFQVLPGGYIGCLDLQKPGREWTEITADGHDVAARKPFGSRFEKRKRLRAQGELRRSD